MVNMGVWKYVFTCVVIKIKIFHSCCTRVVLVALVSHSCCLCLTRVSLVLLMSHSWRTSLAHVSWNRLDQFFKQATYYYTTHLVCCSFVHFLIWLYHSQYKHLKSVSTSIQMQGRRGVFITLSNIFHLPYSKNMSSLLLLWKSKFFTRVPLVLFDFVALVSRFCCSCTTRVALVSLVSGTRVVN